MGVDLKPCKVHSRSVKDLQVPILTNNANRENFFVVVVAARFFHSRSKARLMQWFSVKEVVYFVRVCESHASGAWKEITVMGKSFSPFMHHFNSILSFRISLGSLILRRPRLFAEGTTNNDLGRLRIRLITWLLRMIAASCKLCSWIVPRVKSPLLPSCNGAGLDLEMGPFNYPNKVFAYKLICPYTDIDLPSTWSELFCLHWSYCANL